MGLNKGWTVIKHACGHEQNWQLRRRGRQAKNAEKERIARTGNDTTPKHAAKAIREAIEEARSVYTDQRDQLRTRPCSLCLRQAQGLPLTFSPTTRRNSRNQEKNDVRQALADPNISVEKALGLIWAGSGAENANLRAQRARDLRKNPSYQLLILENPELVLLTKKEE